MRKRAAVALSALVLAGCTASHRPKVQVDSTLVSAPRIVSLAPSLTEIAYAIGCGGQLVGDTRYDDYPEAAKRLPHVADLSHVDLERLSEISPSVIVALHDQEKEGSEIATSVPGVEVEYFPNRSLADLYADMAGVGHVCGQDARARGLAASIRMRVASISKHARGMGRPPRVLYLLGLPGFTVGKHSYLNDLIELAGGVNVAAAVDQPYPNLSAESIVAMNPQVLIVAHDTPFAADVRAREPWRSLDAVRNGRVAVPPDDDIIERPGPRVVEGLTWLAKVLRAP
jgi:iron complex transport system substrate-binding protein